MRSPHINVLPELWQRYNIDHCVIAPSLVGASHTFKLDGVMVELRLPPLPSKAERNETPLSYGKGKTFRTSKISCTHLKGGRPFSYDVHSVDVFVRMRRRISIPTDALGRVNSSLFSNARREQLDRMMKPNITIADEALDRWLRTLRWKTVNGAIGQKQIVGNESGWGAHLFDSATRKQFYARTHFITVEGSRPVSKRAWQQVARALSSGTTPPVWFAFLFEGEHRIGADDLQGGVLCLAIACESMVRRLMTTHMTRPINERFSRLVALTPIGRLLEKWNQLGFWTARWQSATDLAKLRRLFELRNDVAHGVKAHTLKKTECREVAVAVRAFIVHGSPSAEALSPL